MEINIARGVAELNTCAFAARLVSVVPVRRCGVAASRVGFGCKYIQVDGEMMETRRQTECQTDRPVSHHETMIKTL